jgi:hypothetical protein
MDSVPAVPDDAVTAAYPRAAVEQFVKAASIERTRLQEAVEAARARQRTAELMVDQSAETARRVEVTLVALQRELAERRREAEADADALVAAAQAEATAILRKAHLEASAISALDASGAGPDDVDVAAPGNHAGAPEERRAPVPDERRDGPRDPGVVADIDLVAEQTAWRATDAPDGDAIPDGDAMPDADTATDAAAEERVAGSSTYAANGNGSNGNGWHAVNGSEHRAADAPPDAGATSALSTLLRRSRPQPADVPDPEAEQFFDFLRGALSDEAPLGPRDADEQFGA